MVAVVEVAITRDVALSIAQCELTFVDRVVIDFERAALQHAAYCERLEALGIEVIRLRPDEQCPDCCFVEDTAVVLDEVAVLTNMGSPARRAALKSSASPAAARPRPEPISLLMPQRRPVSSA